MPKICDLPSVRGGETEFPISLYRDEESGRVVIRGVNEGGFACVDIDLGDLAECLGWEIDANELAATVAAREHHKRHEEGS